MTLKMTLSWKTSLTAVLLTLTLAPALHASNPRLLAYYGYWPAAAQHDALGVSQSGEGQG